MPTRCDRLSRLLACLNCNSRATRQNTGLQSKCCGGQSPLMYSCSVPSFYPSGQAGKVMGGYRDQCWCVVVGNTQSHHSSTVAVLAQPTLTATFKRTTTTKTQCFKSPSLEARRPTLPWARPSIKALAGVNSKNRATTCCRCVVRWQPLLIAIAHQHTGHQRAAELQRQWLG